MSGLIVGIGASAGGLNAFKTFFANMPPDSGMAFVLVQHLDPHHKSALADILSQATEMAVAEAADGVAVEADRVYIIPPDATLTIEDGVLRVSKPAPPRDRRRPIDSFLASLAEDQGENAVCIVLSGFGSDGTLGLAAVKEHGGLTLAQAEADSTAMEGMPSSAATTGLVDHVLPIEKMPEALISYQRHMGAVEPRKDPDGTRRDAGDHLAEICTLVKDALGHDFSGYKENTLIRRIQRRMQVMQIDTVSAYIERLRHEPDQLRLLFRELLIGVTQFFRDAPAFDALAEKAVPRLLAECAAGEQIRAWVVGCATGEEAYSIAILLHEAAARRAGAPQIAVFATDLDDRAVAAARTGRYPKATVQGLPPERLAKWFIDDGDHYRVVPQIRESCIFSVHSLIKDPPFSRLDLISCRNLLIYLNKPLQERLAPIFHYALLPGGVLFLGPAENLPRQAGLFAVLDGKHRIFARREVASPALPSLPARREGGRSRRTGVRGGQAAPDSRNIRRLVEKYAPAYVVIDEHREVVQFSEQIGRYLGPAPGAASLNFLSLVRRELRPAARGAIRDAISGRQRVVREKIPLEEDGQEATLIVEPIPGAAERSGLYLVAFQELERSAGADGAGADVDRAPAEADDAGTGVAGQDRLVEQARLRAAIEQAETANEELRSANEEYQSVNEELQSTNEELETAKEEAQSINEELQIVNAELNGKAEALLQANSDLQNLLENTQIATLFLGEDLSVRNFTPAATAVFRLRDADRGRPITEIVSRLGYREFEQDVRDVLHRLTLIEREVTATDSGAVFTMRVRPYRKVNKVVDGVVITFVDVTERALAEQQRKLLMAELDHRVKNTLATVQSIAMQTMQSAPTMEDFQRAFEARLQALSNTHNLLMGNEIQVAPLRELILGELSPYAADGRARYAAEGEKVSLASGPALAIGMVFHELATNAAKYGALSVPTGRVEVSWWTVEAGGPECCT